MSRSTYSKLTQPILENLERREVPAINFINLTDGILSIRTDNSATSVTVQNQGTGVRIVEEGARPRLWDYSNVDSITFTGGRGNDTLVNKANGVPVTAYGNGGNDNLTGGNTADLLFGGAGDDVLVGGEGNDSLVGGQGTDSLSGGKGNDILISLDGSARDTIKGGQGNDAYWCDSREWAEDLESNENFSVVTSFSNKGADLTLDGDRIADPETTYGYKRFDNKPLFFKNRPAMTDVTQGYLGDCWLLAGLSAVAKDSPQSLRENIVDFGDGTYGVHYGDKFFRVDNDLPVWQGTDQPVYADLGRGDALWVAIAEKAFSHYRRGDNKYDSLEGGWMIEVNVALRSMAPESKSFASFSNTTELANLLVEKALGKEAVTLGFLDFRNGLAKDDIPIVNYHAYTLVGFVRNPQGTVTGIKLRNPWGVDGKGDDGKDDGIVTISLQDVLRFNGAVNWGKV